MPVHPLFARDGIQCTFNLPGGLRYTMEVSGLEAIQVGGLDRLQAWFDALQSSPAMRAPEVDHVGMITRSWIGFYRGAIGPAPAPAPAPVPAPLPPVTWDGAYTPVTWDGAYTPATASFEQMLQEHMDRAYTSLCESILRGPYTMPPPAPPPVRVAELEPAPPPVPAPVAQVYLGYPVRRTPHVARRNITFQSGILYVNENDPEEVWQPIARAQVARLIQRRVPVSIKMHCRLCGKAYPARQGLAEPDSYCSDRCRTHAADLIDCPMCGGTGNGRDEGNKCGECFGTSFAPCASCQEDHARKSLSFLLTSGAGVYHVCPACVPEERAAGATPAPQMEV